MFLSIEVAGCPTVCRHCWAQGVPYRAMAIEDVAWVLAEVSDFCRARELELGAYPMHEVAAHPDAAALFRLFRDHVGAAEFEPLTTTGVPLALRDDWAAVLGAAAEVGTTTVWFALHGAGAEHDRQAARRGAYAETATAVERVRSFGLRAGCNVFLTTENVARFDELAAAVEELRFDETSWEPAEFCPTPRGRRYERLRPRLSELLPIAERVRAYPGLGHDFWASLEDHTEAAWARDGRWRATPRRPSRSFVCRPNLDLHTGIPGLYRTRHGNLRADGVRAVLERALAEPPWSDDAIWFGAEPLPALEADRFADAEGERVHRTASSVRLLWLDRAYAGGSSGDESSAAMPRRAASAWRTTTVSATGMSSRYSSRVANDSSTASTAST